MNKVLAFMLATVCAVVLSACQTTAASPHHCEEIISLSVSAEGAPVSDGDVLMSALIDMRWEVREEFVSGSLMVREGRTGQFIEFPLSEWEEMGYSARLSLPPGEYRATIVVARDPITPPGLCTNSFEFVIAY